MRRKKISYKDDDMAHDISKKESAVLKAYFKDVYKKTEKETARFRSQPDIDKLYDYIILREKERKTKFERILFPLKIIQGISFTCIGALAAFLFWTKKSEVVSSLDKLLGIHKATDKFSPGLSSQNMTFIFAFFVVAVLVLIFFSYFTLKTDKTK
jgi:hypothetical protein